MTFSCFALVLQVSNSGQKYLINAIWIKKQNKTNKQKQTNKNNEQTNKQKNLKLKLKLKQLSEHFYRRYTICLN